MKRKSVILGLCICGLAAGCGGQPSFSLAWSEYAPWSVFDVAAEKGLIDGGKGRLGPVEKEWGADIVLKQADYDACLAMYGSHNVDAICVTNMDSLMLCLARESVAVLPTSTSLGADACIVVDIEDVDGLKGKPTYGLEKSVSQYVFERCLTELGKDLEDYPFKNMEAGTAAAAMERGEGDVQSIMVWNPFALQTLRDCEGARRLFDSSNIPGEVVDMVVVGKDVLDRPNGQEFVCAVIDTYYRLNELLADEKEGDDTLVALGRKFSTLGLEEMKQVVKETRFCSTPDEALALYQSEDFQERVMPAVVDFCVSHGICAERPTVGFGQPNAQLNFDTGYLQKVKQKRQQ
jgi:NitT/TauT family transport system substrate-binding protein